MVCGIHLNLLNKHGHEKQGIVRRGRKRVHCWNCIYGTSTTLRQSRGFINILNTYTSILPMSKSLFPREKSRSRIEKLLTVSFI